MSAPPRVCDQERADDREQGDAQDVALHGHRDAHGGETIFYYGGGGQLTFNRPYNPYDADNLDEKTAGKYCHRDPDGRIYRIRLSEMIHRWAIGGRPHGSEG